MGAPDSGLYELLPEPERPRTARRTCPVCMATRAAQVCHTCGVDLDTGDFVGIPEPAERPPVELVEDEPELPPAPLPPGALSRAREPLREFADHRVPETTGELLARALSASLSAWVAPLIYLPLVGVALSFQQVPWTNEAFPLPGQILASFVLSYGLLERARAAYDEARSFDIMDMPSNLLRALFLLPLLAGLGRLPPSAYAVLPVAVVLLPLVLGALATDVWSELTPRALLQAARQTPRYGQNALLCSLFLGVGLAAVWAFPEGAAVWRAALAAGGISVAGALAGAARLDAELGDE